MRAEFRTSKFRLISGAILASLGLVIVTLVILNIYPKYPHSNFICDGINSFIANPDLAGNNLQAEAERIKADRQRINELINKMPTEDIGKVQWRISKKLFRLASKHDIKLNHVKYTPVAKIDASTVTLESTNIDFDVVGIYANLKAFMSALEQDEPNSIVTDARLEETAEGGHLVVRLSVFWRPSLVVVQ